MKVIILFIVLFSLTFVSFEVKCQNNKQLRPKIGLALSGGGAKGLAHIGVLKVLEEAGIPIDYITGTSMGSIIGGLYACGYSADEIENIVKGINWSEILGDEISRKNISIEVKDEYERYFLELPMKKWKVIIPTSMVYGQKVSALLSHYTWPVHNINNFDSLPIPFRCIATNIEDVTPVVLSSGYLPDAIRASMAIPSFFKPIDLNGHLLVDGGIVRNFPVQDARDMGADIVIGVDVSAGLYKKDELNSFIRIMDQTSSAQASRANEEQGKLCDILIKPDITNYDLFSFEYMDSLVLNGERAARAILPRLKKLADSLQQIQPFTVKTKAIKPIDKLHIKAIEYEGLEKVSLSLVKANFEIKDTGQTSVKEVEHGIDRLYGTGYFERVNYKLTREKDGTILTLRFKEQDYNFFRMGIHFDQYHKTDILLSVTFPNVLEEGSRLLFDFKIGQYPGVTMQYNVNTWAHPNVGLNIKTSINTFQGRYYDIEGLLQGTYSVIHYTGETDLFTALSRSFLIRAGYQREFFDISNTLESADSVNLNLSASSWYARFRFDTQNRTVFPVKGDNFYAEIKYVMNSKSFNNFGWSPNLWRFILLYNKFIPYTKRIVISPYINFGLSIADKLPLLYNNFLGGFLNGENSLIPFDGMKYMAVSENCVFATGLTFRVEPWANKFISLKTNFGGGASQYTEFWNNTKKYYSIGISAGIKTIIGPLEFTLAKCNNNSSVYGELKFGANF
jgi:NTE family protein